MEEVVLVDCRCVPLGGVPFAIRLTDRRFVCERPVSFKMKPTETVVLDLEEISEARVSLRNPWPLRVWGVLCCVAALGAVVSALQGGVVLLGVSAVAALMAFASFRSANSRFELVISAKGKELRVRQPRSWDDEERVAITAAIRRVEELLSDRTLLEAAAGVERRRIEAPDVQREAPPIYRS